VLVDGVPQTLSLKGILQEFIKHRKEVVRRRTEFDLRKAQEREHILLGLKKALDYIDEIIKIIRASKDVPEAHVNLVKRFKFSDLQTQAILEMRLSRLANLERQKVMDELAQVQLLIAELSALLDEHLVLEEANIPRSDATDAGLSELNAYHQEANLWESAPDEVRPALASLRARGLRLVVVSNANGRLHHLLGRIGLLDSFDHVFDSHHEGVEKPDPRYFEIALTRSGASAESTIHVGDLYHVDVVGARAAGITPVLFDVADRYPDADCRRVRSLTQLAEEMG